MLCGCRGALASALPPAEDPPTLPEDYLRNRHDDVVDGLDDDGSDNDDELVMPIHHPAADRPLRHDRPPASREEIAELSRNFRQAAELSKQQILEGLGRRTVRPRSMRRRGATASLHLDGRRLSAVAAAAVGPAASTAPHQLIPRGPETEQR
jgi:hypothetical protein